MSSYPTGCLIDASSVLSVVKYDWGHNHAFNLGHAFYICGPYLLVNATFSDLLIECPAVRTVLWLISVLATAVKWLESMIDSWGRGFKWTLAKWFGRDGVIKWWNWLVQKESHLIQDMLHASPCFTICVLHPFTFLHLMSPFPYTAVLWFVWKKVL